MGFVQNCCQLKLFVLTKNCVLKRTYTHILQARALTPQTGETDAIRFLVGTQSLKFDNQVWKNERQEKKFTCFCWCFWVFTWSRTLRYNLGSVVFFCCFGASLVFVVRWTKMHRASDEQPSKFLSIVWSWVHRVSAWNVFSVRLKGHIIHPRCKVHNYIFILVYNNKPLPWKELFSLLLFKIFSVLILPFLSVI